MSLRAWIYYMNLLFVVGTAFFVQGVESNGNYRANTCQYQNVTYSARESFKPDPCTFCKCPRRGGEAKCAIMDCKWEPHCLRKERDHSVCCPRCLEYGCVHSDGKVYRKGALVTRDRCTSCYCPVSGGKTVCVVKPCPHPRCVDFEIDKISCCPVCPNGPNCQFNGTIITAGKVLEIDNRRCRCKRLKWSGGTKLFASCRRKHYRLGRG